MVRKIFAVFLALIAAGPLLWNSPAFADDPEIALTIRAHKFEPETLTIPANTRVKLVIRNADATPEEFESYQLNREKVIPGNSSAILYIGPLSPGTYPFFGEFHQATAKGRIVAK